MQPVNIAIVGIKGYAEVHHKSVATEVEAGRARLCAVADINLDGNREAVERLKASGVRIYADAMEMLDAEQGKVDLVTLPVGINAHAPLTIAALERGFNVMVEKPPAATIQEVDRMLEAEKASSGFCAVGFQHQSMPHVRKIKELICSGKIGDIVSVSCVGIAPRDKAYYQRNNWGGEYVVDGKLVLDGPMNNAFAHQLMNVLYFASRTPNAAELPVKVRGEFYRARTDIGGDDLACFAGESENGIKMMFITAHCCSEPFGPEFVITGTSGTIRGNIWGECILDAEGVKESIVMAEYNENSIANPVRLIRGEDKSLNSPLSMGKAMTFAFNAALESSGKVSQVGAEYLVNGDSTPDGAAAIIGLEDLLHECLEKECLPSDLSAPWAQATKWLDTTKYSSFSLEQELLVKK